MTEVKVNYTYIDQAFEYMQDTVTCEVSNLNQILGIAHKAI